MKPLGTKEVLTVLGGTGRAGKGRAGDRGECNGQSNHRQESSGYVLVDGKSGQDVVASFIGILEQGERVEVWDGMGR